jgi:hypothetical protein
MRKHIVVCLLLALALAACAGTATPASQTSDLEARVSALEAQLAATPTAAPETHTEDGDAFGVAVAQYVMDTAGFHAMDEGLNDTKTVDPAYLSTVNRVRKVVAQAPWPEALHEQVEGFETQLADFAAALEADNGEEAATLASSLHNTEHELSHAIDDWLGSTEAEHSHED